MNITAQSVRPNARANVSSSIELGWADVPGWSGKEDSLRGPPPLRTVREPLDSYGSSLSRTTNSFRLSSQLHLLLAKQMHQDAGGD
jgi:hypothetical protein